MEPDSHDETQDDLEVRQCLRIVLTVSEGKVCHLGDYDTDVYWEVCCPSCDQYTVELGDYCAFCGERIPRDAVPKDADTPLKPRPPLDIARLAYDLGRSGR
jgi:hypothetical protein